ncbi:hypothetical protein Ciccas_008301 [Cichlidogyrus casuarinus]|uniref:Uncharacterized protein n=1 Tax=Cichlidogyrus casuarinus TaxID=1844966 RepID=A0ABD2Q0C8_9PLAT
MKKRQADIIDAEETNAKRKRKAVNANKTIDDNALPKASVPQLPPEIRETDRMLAVQRWINNIPRNAKSWAQINLDRVVTLENKYDFPVELHSRQKCPFEGCYECLSMEQNKKFVHNPAAVYNQMGCSKGTGEVCLPNLINSDAGNSRFNMTVDMPDDAQVQYSKNPRVSLFVLRICAKTVPIPSSN